MNSVDRPGLRGIAIAALLTAGIATTIATGGGGGSGGVTPPPSSATLAITAANAHDVASTVVIAIGISFDLGDITDQDMPVQAAGEVLAAPVTKSLGSVYGSLLPEVPQAIENCPAGGTVDITQTIANPGVPTVGDRIVAIFTDCDDGLGYILTGTIDITVAAVQGDTNTNFSLIGIDVVLTGLEVSYGADVVTADGSVTITLDSLDFPIVTLSIAGPELRLGAAGEMLTLTDFDHSLQTEIGIDPEPVVADVLGRLGSRLLGGTVDYDTTLSVRASGNSDPYEGEFLISGAGDSSVRIVIVDSANVTLEVDTNGDGVVDEFIDTNWAALNGNSSSINSSTAPILAREVYNAVLGFGSLAITPGAQFTPLAPFGQLDTLGVSGNFGPVEIACNGGGSATVSGFKAAVDTFNPNDQLDGTFNACARGTEVLSGALSVAVNGYAQTPGDAFQLNASVLETSLRRTFGGTCFTGNGTIDTSYDYVYTSTGLIGLTGSAASFTVMGGGRSQQLSAATVDAQVTAGQPPAMVTRWSSGTITSPDLDGSFTYQSLVPDVFFADDSSATGPFDGELLITAADNSRLHLRALDELNVALEIDLDGDSIIDNRIDTTWAMLGYDDMLCL